MITALHSALGGLHTHQRAFAHHAGRISSWGARPNGSPAEPLADLVGLRQAQNGYAANAAVVRAADQMLGTLLDVLA